MEKPTRSMKLLIGATILIVVALTGIGGLLVILDSLSVTPGLDTTLLVGVIAALGAVISAFISKRQERKAAVEAQLRDKKVPGYEMVIKLVYDVVDRVQKNEKINDRKMRTRMFEIMRQITVWAPDEIVEAFVKFKKSGSSFKQLDDPRHTLDTIADLMLAIRKDLGHDTGNLDRKTILAMFVSDVDELYA
ncbi:MAG: hypothetical protein F4221_03405 [Rhodothermaceae bacterium]|nr:hypothetical protein [Rhodothermaceae bacterium]